MSPRGVPAGAAACRVYVSRGFTLVKEEPHRSFGADLTGQVYELDLAEAERTLLLAVLRGALLDLLATGDIEHVTRAVERHLGPGTWLAGYAW